jgi:hypothetical protein
MQHRRNEAIRVKLFRKMEGWTMSKLEHLLQQAARAERLSKAILDTLTVDRLQAFAADCRAQAEALPNEQPTSDSSQYARPAA